MRLISIAQGKDAFFDDDEDAPYVNTRNYKRYEKQFYSCHSLRKEKAWHVLFLYLERRMRGWWDWLFLEIVGNNVFLQMKY